MVAFGWCRGIEEADALREWGFDYIECGLTSLKLEDEAAHRELLPKYADSPLPVRAFNLFLPGDLKVVGPHVDEVRLDRYLNRAAEALHRIGAGIQVFGSGGARSIPEGWERARAEQQLIRLLDRVADAFKGTGVMLAIEPLNRKETNVINSVAEGAALARQVNRPEIRVLADFYHMDEEKEPLSEIAAHKDWLAHIHLADTGRKAPGTGAYPYAEFAARLQEAGYSGAISAECSVQKADEEIPASLAFMRKTLG